VIEKIGLIVKVSEEKGVKILTETGEMCNFAAWKHF
jgi:hypothetical protein